MNTDAIDFALRTGAIMAVLYLVAFTHGWFARHWWGTREK